MTAAENWRAQLDSWAIPDQIRTSAPAFPYTMDPALFRPRRGSTGESLATSRAGEAIARIGHRRVTAIDVGSGGGAASMALSDQLDAVVGVDESADMLALFADEARHRGLEVRTVQGNWPDVARSAGRADVVLCHHVAYNVADLAPFVTALDHAARHRVVMELTTTHPQTVSSPLWEQFWGLERPEGPTAADALDVIHAVGIAATLETGAAGSLRQEAPIEVRAATTARMLCLGPDRIPEVRRAMEALPPRNDERAVIWWDVEPTRATPR
jgi:SAM-dependent methyltransferase